MPKDQTDYLMTELECLAAIEAFKTTTTVPEWLTKYKELYRNITISPAGFPEIVDCHFGGETFEGIQKFGNLYQCISSLF
jgi:hypothetical protein